MFCIAFLHQWQIIGHLQTSNITTDLLTVAMDSTYLILQFETNVIGFMIDY